MQAKIAAEDAAAAAKAEADEIKQELAQLQAAPNTTDSDDIITRLVQLIYFALVSSLCLKVPWEWMRTLPA
jgi:hypothetical protein